MRVRQTVSNLGADQCLQHRDECDRECGGKEIERDKRTVRKVRLVTRVRSESNAEHLPAESGQREERKVQVTEARLQGLNVLAGYHVIRDQCTADDAECGENDRPGHFTKFSNQHEQRDE